MTEVTKAAEARAASARSKTLLKVAVLVFAIELAACSSQEAPDNNDAATEAQVPAPEYAQRDGDQYIYVGALSDGERAQGKQAAVVTYRYLGSFGDTQKLEMLSDAGARLAIVECSDPCRVAKHTDNFGVVTRVAVQPATIVAAAFRDAALGHMILAQMGEELSDAKNPSLSPAKEPSISPPTITAGDQSDYRGKKGRCRLTVEGTSYMNGSCWVRLDNGGSFQIMSLDQSYFAQLSRSGSQASGFWNAAPGAAHAQVELGPMDRVGACWTNATAEICAWR
ncbi:hypothetical protein Saro_0262 [Novosphingobium aromaticivorans DSM 12444]|uniref:Uncharacterized protein n=1 Tax=Novosphingobium aromaticivorans (strain ATCC 700278 / DSM 12444 / CCUG 56034 / CIP 105152 / NBRC 16084 / F199) TaxID=279238 RepID=Q2GBR3_NOVAD|nr:hypothetical protein [Novosphingobium aromaticivorans]ABD24710.1 hypothetical protein Saro_0262 [Novosphingobium aromaticivorans DSM 12444]SCY19895.1 hypothetical protein SAMN05660666_01005 [Novosphingobium aromaticivorans]